MRKFAVAVEGMSKEQEKAFLAFCKSKKLGWWHWIGNFWLLLDSSDSVSVSDIRDGIKSITGSSACIVLAVRESGAWAGVSKTEPKGKMFEWIRRNWFSNKQS